MLDKFKCKFDNLIGQPYGYKYEIKDQQFYIMNSSTDEITKVEIVKDNRNLVDKTDNQKLSRDEIEKLKKLDDISGKVV